MENEKRPAGNDLPGEVKVTTKKPYRKPSFQHEQVFETTALACGKVLNQVVTCRGNNRKNS